jgi:peptidoglycan-associated lipoprotein
MNLFQCARVTVIVAMASLVVACSSYVRRDEFNATVADLRAVDARLDAHRQALAQELQVLSRRYDTVASQIVERKDASAASGIRIDTVAYFDTGVASLDAHAKALLDAFARTVTDSHADAMITAEGFSDAAGQAEANRRLGQRRAESVRSYLIEHGGLHPAQVQAVSYGEDENRQIVPGGSGSEGHENRRVSLVVDYAGPQVSLSSRRREQASADR